MLVLGDPLRVVIGGLGLVAGATAAAEFLVELQIFIDNYCEDRDDEIDVPTLAMLLWSSTKKAWSIERELCSILNRCLRDDGADSPELIGHAATLARAINLSVVNVDRASETLAYYAWPSGPDAPADKGFSTDVDTTYRGGQMPMEQLHKYLSMMDTNKVQFRTKMFVASSFLKCVKEYHSLVVPS
jgi:hypothetical protein